VHAFGGLREKHRRLSRGVATADHHDVVVDTQLRLHRRRGVVHARAFELGEVLERRLPVLCARGDDHRPRRNAHPVINLHGIRVSVAREPGRAFRDHDLRAELLGLRVRPPGELLS